MKEWLIANKKKVAAVLIVLGVLGAYFNGSIPLDGAIQQITSVLGVGATAPAEKGK